MLVCLLVLPGVAMLLGGAGLGLGYAVGRDDAGYVAADAGRFESASGVVTTGSLDVLVDAGSPDRLLDRLATDVRIGVSGASASDRFVGIGPSDAVDAYLGDVARDQVTDVTDGSPVYRRVGGDLAGARPGAPAQQDFWAASDTGSGPLTLEWPVREGRWTVVLMDAAAAPAVGGDVTVGARSDAVVPTVLVLLGIGAVLTAVAVALIVVGMHGAGRAATGAGDAGAPEPAAAATRSPVVLQARLDPALTRWQWLVKWLLAIPHVIVLAFLFVAFAVLTVVAGVAILFTGRYPRGIFAFNLGVLRWSWRVSYYASTGGIGTDRYPPFRLGADPEYPAALDVAYPERMSRPLVLVKWLLAVPHLLLVALFLGWAGWDGGSDNADVLASTGLLGLLVVFAGVALLFTRRYPRPLFDLVVGLNRWVYRVVAYAALMTDTYPPFRLDQGGTEPGPVPMPPGPGGPSSVERREPVREDAPG